jgi:hypothetical protein
MYDSDMLFLENNTPIPLATSLYRSANQHGVFSISQWLASIKDEQLDYLGVLIVDSKSGTEKKVNALGELMAVSSIMVLLETDRDINDYNAFTQESLNGDSIRYAKYIGALNLFFTVEKLRRKGHACWEGNAKLSELGNGAQLKYSKQAKPVIDLASRDQGTVVTEAE